MFDAHFAQVSLSIKKEDSTMSTATVLSVSACQKMFEEALAAATLRVARKVAQSVHLRRLEKPELIPTKENRSPVEETKEGVWVVTRLDSNGQTVNANDGKIDQWCADLAGVQKNYEVSAELLAKGEGVTCSKADATRRVVRLTSSVTIQTRWGDMNGEAGDYLSNSDYNEVDKMAGQKFAIIQKDPVLGTPMAYEFCG